MQQHSFHLHRHDLGARRPRGSRRVAFTLIEMITVVVIIALLVAIVVPAISMSYRKAKNTRAAADMVSIGTGLDAYREDFGDYPRPPVNTIDPPSVGFAVLGKALLAPGPSFGQGLTAGTAGAAAGTVAATGVPGQTGYQEFVAVGEPDGSGNFVTTAAPPGTEWAKFQVSDGKDGPGFRARPGGKPYGPYIQDGKFRVRGLAILDAWDNPILYFPARPKKPVPPPPGSPSAGEWPLLPLTAADGPNALYNSFHNISFFFRLNDDDLIKARKRMEAVLVVPGDNDFDGVMETQGGKNERAATDRAFLLWSAGPDQNFGATFAGANPTPDEIRKVDDITNFTTGQ